MANGETQDILEPRSSQPAARYIGLAVAVAVVAILAVVARSSATGEQAGSSDTAEAIAFPSLDEASAEPPAPSTTVAVAPRASVAAAGNGVARIGSLPTVDYRWQRVEIPQEGPTDLVWVGELADAIVAVTTVWTDEENATIVTSRSTDGVDWETIGREPLPTRAFISHAYGGEELYVFAEIWESGYAMSGVLMFATADGVTWTQQRLNIELQPDEYVYLQSAAAGPAGLAIAASFETYPGQNQLLDFGDVQVQLDYSGDSYEVSDAVTGAVLSSGSIDELLPGNGAVGLAIHDPETGEVIVTVPHQVWDTGFGYYGSAGSPLPIPAQTNDSTDPDTVSIAYGGYVIAVDAAQGSFRVTEIETGEEVASGTLTDLYQGPAPHLVNPDTGDVILDVTWDEWFSAEDRAQSAAQYYPDDYTSRTELLTSSDGLDWTATPVPGAHGSYVTSILPTDTGFMAWVDSYDGSENTSELWTMNEGRWSSESATSGTTTFNNVVRTGSSLIASVDNGARSELLSSEDGIDWASEIATVPRGDGYTDYITDVTTDGAAGVAALVAHEAWSQYRPLVLEKDGYLLNLREGETTTLTVTDTSSGEVVLALAWSASDDDPVADIVTWDGGVTSIELENGDVLAITDVEAFAALNEQWTGPDQYELAVVLKQAGHWVNIDLPDDAAPGSVARLALVDGRIVIATVDVAGVAQLPDSGSAPVSLAVLVGTPSG